MKQFAFILAALVVILMGSSVMAIQLDISKKSLDETMIYEFQEPVHIQLKITNLGNDDTFRVYNLVGFQIAPEEFSLKKNETKIINFTITPLTKLNVIGPYGFKYYIRGKDRSEIKKEMAFRIVKLKDAFEIEPAKINPDLMEVNLTIKNQVNYNFSEISGEFKSAFFEFSKKFSLKPYEKKTFNVKLDKNKVEKLSTGFYTINSKLKVKDKVLEIESVIEFPEKSNVISTEDYSGFIIRKHIITKENKGNTFAQVHIPVRKNIISRIFTDLEPKPDVVQREGFWVYYIWSRELEPGESFEITLKTNWTIPFLVVVLIVLIVVFSKKYSQKDIDLYKKITFVKAKGGEFALKVSILVKANDYIEKINISDRIPRFVKIYEKFGSITPSKVDERGKKIEWDFEKLDKGERRVLSYIIYSKLGVLGRFALPPAVAIYEKNGKIKESSSNRAFFISETKVKESENFLMKE